MKLTLTILFFLYAVVATATPFAAAAGGDAADAAAADHNSPQFGIQGDVIILKTDCKTVGDCSAPCHDKQAYLDAIAGSNFPEKYANEIACKWTKAPDDAACSYLFTCKKFKPPCGEGKEEAKAFKTGDSSSMCSCPNVCEAARAGFQVGDKPKDECTPK
ncbi:uncharacterized protein J3D65DRAFT_671044 [Phyllosticta citribraziliensis]|uniref:Uncharacterized protein n=1 Tax=Phyllosticta citribraziliensis TaxID=989973 RepID=A0ABR1LB30_9PEZI